MLLFTSWAEFRRIFDNRLDTWWWFGEGYYKEHGQKWPLEDQVPPEGYVFPKIEGLQVAMMCAVLLTVIRFTVEKLIAEPIGKWFGLTHKYSGTPAGPNAKLERLLQKSKRPTSEQVEVAAKDADMEVREAQVWIRRRQRELMPSKLNKFKESLWRFCFYTIAFGYGLHTLWREDFFWNTMLCWVGFPEKIWAIKKSLYYYYVLEGSFYLSLMVSQFMDVKRKDFWEMFIHHIATLALIGGSYYGGCYRIGVIIMATHDISDVFLELAKLGIYLKKEWISNVSFACFAISWVVFRLIILPFRVTFSAVAEAHYVIGSWPVHPIYITFLLTLQVLHIYWFMYIVKVIVKIAAGSQVDKDDRSEDEGSSEEDE